MCAVRSKNALPRAQFSGNMPISKSISKPLQAQAVHVIQVFHQTAMQRGMHVEQIGYVQSAAGAGRLDSAGAENALNPQAAVHPGAVIATPAGGHAEIVFEDGTTLSLGELSSLEIRHYAHAHDAPGSWSLDLALNQGTFRILSGQIADNADGGIRLHTPSAMVLLDQHGGDITVHDELTQVGSPADHGPGPLVTTAVGTTRVADGILDILPDGRFGEVRDYSDFEQAYFKVAAPLSNDPADTPHPADDQTDMPPADGHAGDGDDDVTALSWAIANDAALAASDETPDGTALLNLFTAYYGQAGVDKDMALSLFQSLDMAQGALANLDDGAAITAEVLQAIVANTEAEHPAGDDDTTRAPLFGEHEADLQGPFAHWDDPDEVLPRALAETGHEDDPLQTPTQPDDKPLPEVDQNGDGALAQGGPILLESNFSVADPVDDTSPPPAPEPPAKDGLDFDNDFRAPAPNMDFGGTPGYQANGAGFGGGPGHTNLLGGAEGDDLNGGVGDTPDPQPWEADPAQGPAGGTYDDWSATAEASETTTNQTFINVPEYSFGISFHTLKFGWLTIRVPVPVIKVHYTEQLISSETTTTTTYDDGALQSRTMTDADADGHWDQSASTLTYADGAQRSVTLFDQDDDGAWDTYEASLVYQDGEVANSDSGSYAEAPDDVLAYLALADDDSGPV